MKKNNIEKNFSIIIPSRKIDINLDQCLSQIRKYYKKIKIILILDEYNKIIEDKNISILITKNKTIGYKRNLAVKNSNTKFVCFIDSDAYPKSPWLNNVLEIFKKNNKIAGVGGPNLSPRTNNIEKIIVSRARKLSFVTLNKDVKFIPKKNKSIKFLPSCNLIVRKDLYLKSGGMDDNLYSGEEISLNYNLIKNGYILIFSPHVIVFHKDRNFKHFARQRFIYGSTGLRLFMKYPNLQSFQLLIASFPIFFLLSIFFIINNKFLLNSYFIGLFTMLCLIVINSIKINYKKNFFKSFKLTLISVFYPGYGLILSFFVSDKKLSSFYTQR
jgi:cellulose synthase/poly-beta-1,6-N-acetylglucosamine synthase-like glycosyltransferase